MILDGQDLIPPESQSAIQCSIAAAIRFAVRERVFSAVAVEAVPGMDPQGAAELNDYVEHVEDTERRLHDRSGWASTILQDHAAAVVDQVWEASESSAASSIPKAGRTRKNFSFLSSALTL